MRQWRIIYKMVFIETPIFTKEIRKIMSDDSYRAMQQALLLRPEAGSLIPGSNGLRKLRWSLAHSGKRGGVRIIYYWEVSQKVLYMLFVYRKTKQTDLTQKQIAVLSKLVKEYLQ